MQFGLMTTQTYEVVIAATDPSGANGIATVTVTVKDVNEAPKFTTAAKADTQKTLYIDENVKNEGTAPLLLWPCARLRALSMALTNAPGAYVAEDEDADSLDVNTAIRYKVEGANAKHFAITDEGDTLSIRDGRKASWHRWCRLRRYAFVLDNHRGDADRAEPEQLTKPSRTRPYGRR